MEYTIVEYEYNNKHGTSVKGQIHLPFKNGVFYKPIKITATSGVLDNTFYLNNGKQGLKHRICKKEYIDRYTSGNINDTYSEIVKPFTICNGCGLISAIGHLAGSNSNREASMMIKINNRKYKAAKIFQNLKSINADVVKYIDFKEILKQQNNQIYKLIANYEKNIKTVSTDDIKEKYGNN